MPFDEGTFDCVVSTWTMCSIPEVGRALGEVYRVLRPGGRLVFLEHGLSEDLKVQKWQRRLNPIERVLADGCRLDLDVEAVVRGQPFSQVRGGAVRDGRAAEDPRDDVSWLGDEVRRAIGGDSRSRIGSSAERRTSPIGERSDRPDRRVEILAGIR